MSLLSLPHRSTELRTPQGWPTVVDDVTFDVAAGQTLAVVGASGSGKSVTALSITRLLPAELSRAAGLVMFDSTDIPALPERQMKKVRGNDIAMILQEPMGSLTPGAERWASARSCNPIHAPDFHPRQRIYAEVAPAYLVVQSA